MKIYTKTGDDGTTLCNKKRVLKSDTCIDFLGNMDELNSHIGYVSCLINNEDDVTSLRHIQNNLFDISAYIGYQEKLGEKNAFSNYIISEISWLEKQMDETVLPPLSSFILSGSDIISSYIHIIRTICRRTERSFVCLGLEYPVFILKYLNRLSDYFFILARKHTKKEIKYVKWQSE